MTEVSFHFNVSDKTRHACALLRKAHRLQKTVGVVGPESQLQELDTALWTFSALDFVPHCTSQAPASVLSATPIVLSRDCAAISHSEMLLHLGDDVPTGFERFRRLIELVGLDADDRQRARNRWRYYAERGYAIKRWDVAASTRQRRHA